MPISRREFEAGRSGPEFTIIEMLRLNRDRAFTALELWRHLDQQGEAVDMFELQRLLEDLIRSGDVAERIVTGPEGQVRHFSYGRSLGFRSSGGR